MNDLFGLVTRAWAHPAGSGTVGATVAAAPWIMWINDANPVVTFVCSALGGIAALISIWMMLRKLK